MYTINEYIVISTQKLDTMKKEPKGNSRNETYNNWNGTSSRLESESVNFKLDHRNYSI